MTALEQRVLAAAARLFARFGFHRTSTRAIASEAGVGEKSIFRRFGSKTALFDRVKQRIAAPLGFLTRMEIALQSQDFESAIRGFAHEYSSAFSPERIRTLLQLGISSPTGRSNLFDAERMRMHALLSARISAAQRSGEARVFDADRAAWSLLRLLLGHSIAATFFPDQANTSNEHLDSFVDIWLAAFIVAKSRGSRQRALSAKS